MTTRAVPIFAESATDGTGLTGLSPTWVFLRRDDGTDLSATYAITQVNAVTNPGEYRFTPTLTAGQWLTGKADLGASADPRYIPVYVTEQDLRDVSEPPTASAIATQVDTTLTASHGSGSWAGAAGSGTQTPTLTVRSDGAAIQGAKVTVYNSSGTQVAQLTSGAAGTITPALDVGSYTTRTVLPGNQWAVIPIVVTSPNTVSPTTLDGESLPGRLVTREGISGTCSLTSPAHDAKITGITAGEDVTLTRTCLAVTSGQTIASVAYRFGLADKAEEWGEVAGTVSDTSADGTGAFTIALTPALTRAHRRGVCDYEIEVTLSGGTVHVVESGKVRTRPEIG